MLGALNQHCRWASSQQRQRSHPSTIHQDSRTSGPDRPFTVIAVRRRRHPGRAESGGWRSGSVQEGRMLKRLNERARPLAAAFLIAAANADAAASSTWEGAFQTTTTWGAMALEIADGGPTATVRLRIAPDARPSE